MKRKWTIDYTSRSWGFGLEFGLPSQSKEFFVGTKLQTYFSLTVYLGPFTFDWSKEPTVMEYENDEVKEYLERLTAQ